MKFSAHVMTAVIAAALLALSSQASATMEAAWTSDPEGETIHHEKPHCPNFIVIQRKDGSTEEHIWSHHVLEKRSSVDSGECVFY